jgi:putative membrane protein
MHRPKRAILLIGGGSVALGGLLLAHHLVEAPIARQMVTHILLMSFVAPMVAGWTVRKLGSPLGDGLPRLLFAATAIQLVAIYLWHLPPGFDIAAAMPRGRLLMHATLLSAATWYWYAIFASLSRHRWHALFSLLVTGKLFCILGALFVFSPREILSSSLPTAGYNVLQDQQLAGLRLRRTSSPPGCLKSGALFGPRPMTTVGGCSSAADAAVAMRSVERAPLERSARTSRT